MTGGFIVKENTVLTKMRSGEPAAIGWLTAGSPLLAEIVAGLGFDGIILDTQHGYWSYEAMLNALQVILPTPTIPFVRVARNEPDLIGLALDAGALGVIVPLVNTPEQAARAVAAARYAPAGSRSVGGVRLRLYGSDYVQEANRQIMVATMTETSEAIENVRAIAAVPGVDCLFIGPSDLALSLGCYPERNQAHSRAIAEVIAAGREAGVPVGMACSGAEDCLQRARDGMLFLAAGNDASWCTAGATTHLKTLRTGLARE